MDGPVSSDATRYAFAIDHRRCIGCHACTVACKQEHGVEIGVFRTWVKYIERGEFPDTQRHFSVLRCNHCENAPCITACPVTALFRRDDGIVDFDPHRCIGCKACMNACPYDALYIDPHTLSAAKCNFCAHRIDTGLKPSCEVVCPTGAIISGDLSDPDSEVSRILGTTPATVRAPEQGTEPNVFYLGADEAAITPLQVSGGQAYLTTEVVYPQREKLEPLAEEARAVAMTDIPHGAPWGWKVSSYFLTKGIAAGAMMFTLLLLLVDGRASTLAGLVPGLVGLAGIAATGLLLVWDLTHPGRFHYLFVRPQWQSWLTLGAQVINLSALTCFAFTLASFLGDDTVRDVLAWPLVPVGAMLAGYTAFLFNQMEGRDLWQSPLLLPHMIVNAVIAGTGTLALAALIWEPTTSQRDVLGWALVVGSVLSLAIALADVFGHHSTRQAERAARNLRRDVYMRRFWSGVAALPVSASLAIVGLTFGAMVPLAAAGLVAMLGLWLYEDAWIRAGQSVPLS